MSHSPTTAGAALDPRFDDYMHGWGAVFEMSREGASWSGRERNVAFLNLGDGRFADVSGVSGTDWPDDGRAAAVTDWDLDGDLDVWLANRTGPRLRLLRNDTASDGDFLALALEGRRSNRDGIGARIEVSTRDGRKLVRTLRAGEGFLAQSSKWLHFGLGHATLDEVVVRWPSGVVDRLRSPGDLTAGRRYRIVEGSGHAELLPSPGAAARLGASVPEPPPVPSSGRLLLSARPRFPALTYRDFADTEHPLRAEGRPFLVNLWASWCAPCVAELEALTRDRRRLEAAGLALVALSVDEDRDQARRLVDALDPWFAVGFASPDLLDVLDILQKSLMERHSRLPLPSSFLVDPRGRLGAVYRGALDPTGLLRDVAIMRLSDPAAIRTRATPFAGRWSTRPTPFPDALLADEFDAYGHPAVAAQYRPAAASETEAVARRLDAALALAREGRRAEAVPAMREAIDAAIRRLREHPADLETLNNLGIGLAAVGESASALEAFRRVLDRAPDDTSALFYAGLLEGQAGNASAAQDLLRRLAAVDAERARTLRRALGSTTPP